MSKFPIYVVDKYHADALTYLSKIPNITVVLNGDPAVTDWRKHAKGILIRSETRLSENDFAQAPSLQVVVKQGIGVDNIDLEAAKKHGVKVFNTPGQSSDAVAELVLATALSLGRRVTEMDRRIREGERLIRTNWQLSGRSLSERIVGIVGMGNIGRQVAKKWIGGMDATIVWYDPFASEEATNVLPAPHKRVRTLDELLAVADVVTLHMPLTPQTKGLIGAHELDVMKKDAILINMARGGIVDEPALLQTLKSNKLWGVGLDTMNIEPPTVEDYGEFLESKNLILTPHIAGSTLESEAASSVAAATTLIAALNGEDAIGRQA